MRKIRLETYVGRLFSGWSRPGYDIRRTDRGRRRAGVGLGVERDAEHVERGLHQRLSGVGEHKVVVRHAVADGIVRAHYVEKGGEERQGVTVLRRREVRDPLVGCRVGVSCA